MSHACGVTNATDEIRAKVWRTMIFSRQRCEIVTIRLINLISPLCSLIRRGALARRTREGVACFVLFDFVVLVPRGNCLEFRFAFLRAEIRA